MVSALLLVSDVFIGVIFYKKARSLLVEQMLENTKNTAATVGASIDGKDFEEAKKGDTESASYKKVFNQLVLFRDNSGVEYVYTVVESKKGTLVYAIDSAVDNPAQAGDEFTEVDDILNTALKGTPIAENKAYTDKWGTHYSAYAPIYNGKKVVGIACVDNSFEWVQKVSKEILVMVVSICAIIFAIGIVILLFIRHRLSRGFKMLNDKVEELAGGGGDLTKKIEIKSGDEFEVIGENVNSLVAYIRDVMVSITNSTNSLKNVTSIIFTNLETASKDTDRVGGALRELSVTMQNTENAMGEINELVSEINNVFGGIVTEVRQGSDYAHDIRRQAKDIGDDAMKAQTKARKDVEDMQAAIREKLDRSEAVKQINVLTDDIMIKFEEMSTNVQSDIDEIKNHTSTVNDKVRESTSNINDAANKALDVTGNIGDINTEAEKATCISDELSKAVGKFKVN